MSNRSLDDLNPGDTLRAEITVEGKKNLSDGKRGVMSGRVRVFNQRAEQVFEFSEKLMMRRGRVDNLV
jgi:3-hydroxybutyryl-CoA dehydratase